MGIKKLCTLFTLVTLCLVAKAQTATLRFSARMLEKPSLYTSELEAIFKVSETKKYIPET